MPGGLQQLALRFRQHLKRLVPELLAWNCRRINH